MFPFVERRYLNVVKSTATIFCYQVHVLEWVSVALGLQIISMLVVDDHNDCVYCVDCSM